MDQINYQSYDGQGKFDPVTRVNAIPALDRRNQLLRRGEENYLRGIQQNNQVRIQNAKQQGEGLQALAKFSQTLTDFLVEKEKADMEQRIQEEDAAGEAQAYQDFMSGNLTRDKEYEQKTQFVSHLLHLSNQNLSDVSENIEDESYEHQGALYKL